MSECWLKSTTAFWHKKVLSTQASVVAEASDHEMIDGNPSGTAWLDDITVGVTSNDSVIVSIGHD